jgi:hypothetical protein
MQLAGNFCCDPATVGREGVGADYSVFLRTDIFWSVGIGATPCLS